MAESAQSANARLALALHGITAFCEAVVDANANAGDRSDADCRATLCLAARSAKGILANLASIHADVRAEAAQAQSAERPNPPKGAWTPWGFMPAQPDFHASNDHSPVPPSHPE